MSIVRDVAFNIPTGQQGIENKKNNFNTTYAGKLRNPVPHRYLCVKNKVLFTF
jgi:hypothetical protein